MDLSEISENPHRHPWEMSRADFLMAVIDRHVDLTKNSELLDVGAGDLFFSERIHGATHVKIDAVDQAFDEEGPRGEAIQKIKYLSQVLHKKYHAVCALDVLEHVENDQEFFDLILGMMKPGATFMITVPAFQILFSDHHHLTRSLGLILGTDALVCRFLAKLGIKIPGLSLCMVLKRKS